VESTSRNRYSSFFADRFFNAAQNSLFSISIIV
jgi:hypothetical protein